MNKAFGCFHGKGLLSSFDLAVFIRFYLIPTPILAKTSRNASAAAATIQTMLYKGFSNKRAGIPRQDLKILRAPTILFWVVAERAAIMKHVLETTGPPMSLTLTIHRKKKYIYVASHKAGHFGIPARQLAEIPRSPHSRL